MALMTDKFRKIGIMPLYSKVNADITAHSDIGNNPGIYLLIDNYKKRYMSIRLSPAEARYLGEALIKLADPKGKPQCQE